MRLRVKRSGEMIKFTTESGSTYTVVDGMLTREPGEGALRRDFEPVKILKMSDIVYGESVSFVLEHLSGDPWLVTFRETSRVVDIDEWGDED